MVRQSYTATVERNRVWQGEFATEPYECGWAGEAIFFVRKLEAQGAAAGTAVTAGQHAYGYQRETPGPAAGTPVRVQISGDGMRWCDEGTILRLTDAEVDFVKVSHFGQWLRLVGELPEGVSLRVIVSLALKE